MRCLVTGSAGFVGKHLTAALQAGRHTVTGFDLRHGDDIRDYEQIRTAVEAFEPDRVFHLAAAAWPGESLADPQRHLDVNATGTLNLLRAVRAAGSDARVLLAGTSEEYGYEGHPDGCVITEDSPCRPTTPYGASKLAASTMGMVYARRFGLHVAVTRAWNHTGPGRQAVNAESAFARRIVAVERGEADSIPHGDLSSLRNFTDVRDVIAAYRIAIEQPPGIYNVASESTLSLRDVMNLLLSMSRVPAAPLKEAAGLGRADRGTFPGVSAEKLRTAGWVPEIPLAGTFADLLDYWRSR